MLKHNLRLAYLLLVLFPCIAAQAADLGTVQQYDVIELSLAGLVTKITPVETIRRNAKYYKKLRFSLTGGRFVDPTLKPFLDERGRQTDDGRYSQRPNPAWFCLANKWNIKRPTYTAAEIVAAGNYVSGVLPYPTPVSVHGNRGPWDKRLNGAWHDHVILQDKIKSLDHAAKVARGRSSG